MAGLTTFDGDFWIASVIGLDSFYSGAINLVCLVLITIGLVLVAMLIFLTCGCDVLSYTGFISFAANGY